MTDINKVIMEKAHGGGKLKPDEQNKYLGTFAERVIGYCTIEQANSVQISQHFKEILSKILQEHQPVAVKISSELESKQQVFYLKTAKELQCQATIVSSQNSWLGLVLHSDQVVDIEEKDLLQQFSSLFKAEETSKKKTSFWGSLFGN